MLRERMLKSSRWLWLTWQGTHFLDQKGIEYIHIYSERPTSRGYWIRKASGTRSIRWALLMSQRVRRWGALAARSSLERSLSKIIKRGRSPEIQSSKSTSRPHLYTTRTFWTIRAIKATSSITYRWSKAKPHKLWLSSGSKSHNSWTHEICPSSRELMDHSKERALSLSAIISQMPMVNRQISTKTRMLLHQFSMVWCNKPPATSKINFNSLTAEAHLQIKSLRHRLCHRGSPQNSRPYNPHSWLSWTSTCQKTSRKSAFLPGRAGWVCSLRFSHSWLVSVSGPRW